MEVFVIPIAHNRYALYCEPVHDLGDDEADGARGILGRARAKFSKLVHMAEEWQHRKLDDDQPQGIVQKVQDGAMSWIAQRVAEQRLLWNLRGQTEAVVAYPQDMTFDQVNTLVRGILQHDYERHRRWGILDGIAFVVTSVLLGPFFLLVPGVANLPAFYFGFRAFGHLFAMRGAAQGLHRVTWSGRPCPPLTELREVSGLEPDLRDARVHDIASRLRLQHLSSFVERVALRHA